MSEQIALPLPYKNVENDCDIENNANREDKQHSKAIKAHFCSLKTRYIRPCTQKDHLQLLIFSGGIASGNNGELVRSKRKKITTNESKHPIFASSNRVGGTYRPMRAKLRKM
jgi:hypothetical protein